MGNESGTWIMFGMDENDPKCINSVENLEKYINEVGFLPLFKNEIGGFSVEEHTSSNYWWSGDKKRDPWEWREIIAARGEIAYGKFFGKKAGFISKEWLPDFANFRRDGYDFDSLWEDGKASMREKKIMDVFEENESVFSNELKVKAGFGKGGEKNFDGIMTLLQMKTYLCIKEFRLRKNKKGDEYGWPIAVYTTPEELFGYKYVTSAYSETPEKSKERIMSRIKELYPEADDKYLKKI